MLKWRKPLRNQPSGVLPENLAVTIRGSPEPENTRCVSHVPTRRKEQMVQVPPLMTNGHKRTGRTSKSGRFFQPLSHEPGQKEGGYSLASRLSGNERNSDSQMLVSPLVGLVCVCVCGGNVVFLPRLPKCSLFSIAWVFWYPSSGVYQCQTSERQRHQATEKCVFTSMHPSSIFSAPISLGSCKFCLELFLFAMKP